MLTTQKFSVSVTVPGDVTFSPLPRTPEARVTSWDVRADSAVSAEDAVDALRLFAQSILDATHEGHA